MFFNFLPVILWQPESIAATVGRPQRRRARQRADCWAACQPRRCHFIIITVSPNGALKRCQAPCQAPSMSHLLGTSWIPWESGTMALATLPTQRPSLRGAERPGRSRVRRKQHPSSPLWALPLGPPQALSTQPGRSGLARCPKQLTCAESGSHKVTSCDCDSHTQVGKLRHRMFPHFPNVTHQTKGIKHSSRSPGCGKCTPRPCPSL